MNNRFGPIAKTWRDVALAGTGGGGGGGVTDGDKVDIVVSGAGSTWTIDSNAVTYAKVQVVRAERLLGNPQALDGTLDEINLGDGLQFSSGALVCTAASFQRLAGTMALGGL
jgi:hypothetical protein